MPAPAPRHCQGEESIEFSVHGSDNTPPDRRISHFSVLSVSEGFQLRFSQKLKYRQYIFVLRQEAVWCDYLGQMLTISLSCPYHYHYPTYLDNQISSCLYLVVSGLQWITFFPVFFSQNITAGPGRQWLPARSRDPVCSPGERERGREGFTFFQELSAGLIQSVVYQGVMCATTEDIINIHLSTVPVSQSVQSTTHCTTIARRPFH